MEESVASIRRILADDDVANANETSRSLAHTVLVQNARPLDDFVRDALSDG